MSGYVTPSITENINDAKKMLFNDIKDSFEKRFILSADLITENLKINKNIDINTIIEMNANK